MESQSEFVLGLDLDGVVADFYSFIRLVTAEWRDIPVDSLTDDVTYGFPEWGLAPGEYERIHRFAVTQKGLFAEVPILKGAAPAIRRLGSEGVRIRIITHRLFIRHFHQLAVEQTVAWLDRHAVPYWDLCFMRDKQLVNADIYLEDSPKNIACLENEGLDVITFTNSTNKSVPVKRRALDWQDAEKEIRKSYYTWRMEHDLPLPPGPGLTPPGFSSKI